jgi:hypothetical protein
MNEERMQLRGQLADAKHRYRELDTEAGSLITLIRLYLDPKPLDVTALKIPEARVQMERLAAIHREMTALKGRIAGLDEALNG